MGMETTEIISIGPPGRRRGYRSEGFVTGDLLRRSGSRKCELNTKSAKEGEIASSGRKVKRKGDPHPPPGVAQQ